MRKNLFQYLLFLLICPLVLAQEVDVVPKLINYQGKLTDAVGLPLAGEAGGTFRLRFAIFPEATAGTAVWAEERNVVVIGGLFNVALGGAGGESVEEISMDLGSAFAGPARFLQITIVSGPEGTINQTLAPRQQLASTPFAIVSQTTDRAAVAALAESLIPHLAQALNPPGTIIAYAGTVGADTGELMEPIPGYLLCNGAVIDGTALDGKFAALSAALSTNWGNGNDGDLNTVALPDLRGVFLRGWNGMVSDDYADPERDGRVARNAGGNTGNNIGSFQQDVFKSHRHSFTGEDAVGQGGGDLVAFVRNGSGGPQTKQTSSTGGSETRGKNAYVAYLIKY